MKKRIKLKRLGRKTSHRKALLRNLVQSLVINSKVETTITKAKALKQEFDRFVSYFHRTNINDETKLRYGKGFFTKKEALVRFYEVVLPYSIGRIGGYTRIVRTRDRKGDGATMALVTLVNHLLKKKTVPKKTDSEQTKDVNLNNKAL